MSDQVFFSQPKHPTSRIDVYNKQKINSFRSSPLIEDDFIYSSKSSSKIIADNVATQDSSYRNRRRKRITFTLLKNYVSSVQYFMLFIILSAKFSEAGLIQKMVLADKKDDTAQKRLDKTDIEPPEHLAGVHMNRDGGINEEYNKEVFLGPKEEHLFAARKHDDQARKLREIFTWVDSNHDGHIVPKELAEWVLQKTKEHFDEAQRNNEQRFVAADINGDSQVNWIEWKAGFLYQHGVLPSGILTIRELIAELERLELENKRVGHQVQAMDQDLDDDAQLAKEEETNSLDSPIYPLDPELNLKLQEFQIQWAQSDEDHDNILNELEFLDFLHPEYSKGMLRFMVEEILTSLDVDGDRQLTLAEFVSLPDGENIDQRAMEDEWIAARRDEFQDVVDHNQDGIITMSELERYLDPLNEQSALAEAKQMISFGDANENGSLEVHELIANSEFFTGSKLVDYAKAAHEEF